MLMVWTFNNSDRMFTMIERFADVMGQVGLFNFTVDINGYIAGSVPARMLAAIPKYPKVNWLLTIQNLNTSTDVVNALLNNTNGARTNFFNEMARLLTTYPQCDGIDIDLEKCGGYSNQAPMRQFIAEVYNWCHARGKLLNVCMPPITGPNASVGGEYWCAYEDYANTVDTMTIMSYAFAWLGSSPGPVSPKWWLEQILAYSTRVVPKSKILLGIGAWAIMWGLHIPYSGYKATSGTYYWPLFWMQGQYNFHDFRSGEGVTWPDRQPKIPFTGYWSDYEKVCYMMPHVYDYVDGNMYDHSQSPLVDGVQDGRHYVVGFTKYQRTSGTSYQSYAVGPVNNNNVIKGSGAIVYGPKIPNKPAAYVEYVSSREQATLSSEDQQWLDYRIEQVGYDGLNTQEKKLYESTQPARWEYVVSVPYGTCSRWKLALDMNFPWFDSNGLYITVDGVDYSIREQRFWNVTFRQRHIEVFFEGELKPNTTHKVVCGALGNTVGAVVYKLLLCPCEDINTVIRKYNVELFAGQAEYTMSTQQFVDVDGNKVTPADNYAMTIETLRTPPDSANIWYEDYRGYSEYGPSFYSDFWETEGNWKVIENDYTDTNTSQKLRLNGISTLKRTTWTDVHVYARWQSGSGRVGVVLGDLFACMNYANNQLQLWNGSNLVHAISYTMNGEQAIAMRVRNGTVRVYTGTNKVLQFTVNTSTGSGSPGIRSTTQVIFTLCRIGSGWWYEPYECYDLTVLGQTTRLGRVARTNVTWDDELQVFRVNDDVEESSTRTETLSLDYDFQYMGRMPILKGKEYQDIPVVYKPVDINIRHMRTYIGDADGFGIMYYEDADVIQYWYNRAMCEYGIKGMCMWSLGQEDCRIWERISAEE